jgi:hypothetical protein
MCNGTHSLLHWMGSWETECVVHGRISELHHRKKERNKERNQRTYLRARMCGTWKDEERVLPRTLLSGRLETVWHVIERWEAHNKETKPDGKKHHGKLSQQQGHEDTNAMMLFWRSIIGTKGIGIQKGMWRIYYWGIHAIQVLVGRWENRKTLELAEHERKWNECQGLGTLQLGCKQILWTWNLGFSEPAFVMVIWLMKKDHSIAF